MSCSCDLIGSAFTNSSQTCSNNILSFSTTLSYATNDGSITASYIIALLNLVADLNNGKNTSLLVIDGQNINIISDKKSPLNTWLMVVLPFAGFAVGTTISGIIFIMLIMYVLHIIFFSFVFYIVLEKEVQN